MTAEKVFDRRWATTLLDRAMERLREECLAADKGALFSRVQGLLSGQPADSSYANIGADLGTSEGANDGIRVGGNVVTALAEAR